MVLGLIELRNLEDRRVNIKSLMMKFYIKCKERKFSDGVHQLKYIVRRKRNAPLVVVFSAFAGGRGVLHPITILEL